MSQGVYVLGGKCPGGICPWGKCPGGTCPGGYVLEPEITYEQGCQFSDFSLISDFLRIKKTCIKLIKSGQNIVKFSMVSKDRLDNGKGLDNPSLITVSIH